MAAHNWKIRKESSFFTSQGVRCAGDLFTPVEAERPPVVVMAHGLAFERTFGLQAIAEHFTSAGMAVYLFDYRCFGDSEGEPRNFVDPGRHIQDWQAAISHVRSLPNINTSRIALWGTSFSGGHVVVVAGQDPGISAISIQAPFLDSISTIRKLGLRYVLQAIPHAFRDMGRMVTFRSPYYVKSIGAPNEFAVVNTIDSLAGAESMIPAGVRWQNRCPARILLRIPFYRPIAWAARVQCPALVIYGENDNLIDSRTVRRAAAKMAKSRILGYPVGHFEFYNGKIFDEVVEVQADFLAKYLGVRSSGRSG